MKLFIKNIKHLGGIAMESPAIKKGKALAELPFLSEAWLAIEDGLILDYGLMADWPGITDWRNLEVIDAENCMVLPGWIDSHTHLVFAGNRVAEFEDRLRGLSYQDIAAKGGGILNSAKLLDTIPEEVLFETALQRAQQAMQSGTVALEIKSGYGLSTEAELKMLRVIHRLKTTLPIPIKATYLGAHAVPGRFNGDTDAYLREIITETLPEIARQKLADYVDIFCETNYFGLDHLDKLLEASAKFGLKAKVHVNQFNAFGGVKHAIQHGALTVDHLEVLNDEDIPALLNSETIPVALPGCSFFLGIPYTPGRTIIDAGLPLALASDFNPGSSPSYNMNFVVALASIKMKLLPEEAINAATINAAYAMEIDQISGSITPGKKADFIITKPMNSLAQIAYSFGESPVASVFVNGIKIN